VRNNDNFDMPDKSLHIIPGTLNRNFFTRTLNLGG